jgi:hypothetical protein
MIKKSYKMFKTSILKDLDQMISIKNVSTLNLDLGQQL